MSAHLSPLFWARYLADELSWLQRLKMRRHLGSCEECRRAQLEIEAERRSFEQASPRALGLKRLQADAFSRGIRPAPAGRWGRLAIPGLAALAACALVVVLSGPTELRAKGGDLFVLLSKRGDASSAPLSAQCVEGERLRARYRSTRPFLFIVGVDGSGSPHALFPMNGTGSQRISPGEALTPGSWTLDDQLGTERFLAFFSDAPVSLEQASEAIRAAGTAALQLPEVSIHEQHCEKSPK
jgi:hypothetical protein